METKRFNPKFDEGLTNEQVNQKIEENLININEQPQTKTIKQIIYSNVFTYFNFLNIFLGASIIIAGLIYNKFFYSLKNCLFMGTIICNTIISTFQEITSKKIIDKLSFLASTKTTVIRNSRKKLISNEEIVLDDIIYLEIGNEVPTDCIILNGKVEANESLLTGEVDPIYKDEGKKLLSGSFIVSGSCYAKVNHVGKDNYIAKISKEAKYNKKVNSIIMGSFNQLLKILSILIIPIGILFFINQITITGNVYDSVIATVAALIGMIPEGLILLTSSVMAVSIIRLSKYKVLVQQLYCIETLARVNVICLDKTGTITEGKMKVYDTIIEKNHTKKEIDKILGEICASAEDHSATFTAIKNTFKSSEHTWKVKEIMPFSSERKFSAVSFENENTYYLGAPDFILKEDYENEKAKIENFQKKYRVLLLAKSTEKPNEHPKKVEKLAYILIKDVVRKDAKETLDFFAKEGVEVKVISGDNYNTVMSIAEEAGIKNIKGIDATTLNDETIKEAALNYNIFGRVTPKQKKQIIKALKENGKTVAMTGDGINDVLALKEADCSIAMASGTDGARNVSQLVLLNSDFSSIPHIVAEGRRTINNIERSASLLLVKTIFTILLVLLCIILGSKYFFIPIQLTLITTFTIGIPSFILALEPNTNVVKGNFLVKVIGKSVPAALTVVFNVIIVEMFKYAFNLPEDVVSSLVVFLTGISGFIFLYKLCEPFNAFRFTLWITLLTGFEYCVIFQSSFFNINSVTYQIALIFGVLLICSLYIFDKLNKIVSKLLDKYETKNI